MENHKGSQGPVDGSAYRTSRERVAHMLCALSHKAEADSDGHVSLELPLGMTIAGHALGLTPIHFHVVMRYLAAEGLLTIAGQTITILDVERLQTLADSEL